MKHTARQIYQTSKTRQKMKESQREQVKCNEIMSKIGLRCRKRRTRSRGPRSKN